MKDRPIAVLSSNYAATIDWLEETRGAKPRHPFSTFCNDANGKTFLIIAKYEEALGWEFSDMLIAPDYESLETTVRSRIK